MDITVTKMTRARDIKPVFVFLFLLAVLGAVLVTFLGLSGVDPADPITPLMLGVLALNFILIAILGVRFLIRYRNTQAGPILGRRGGLTRRFVVRFSIAAIIPASIFALLLFSNVLRGIDSWFSQRVEASIDQAVTIAKNNIDDLILSLDLQFTAMSDDIDNAHQGFNTEKPLFQDYFQRQITSRNLAAAWLINQNGDVLMRGDGAGRYTLPDLDTKIFDEAKSGQVVKTLFEDAGIVSGLTHLDQFDGQTYLLAIAVIDPQYLANMRGLEASYTDLRNARESSRRLYTVFGFGYVQIAILLLILAAHLALEAAQQVTEPIREMAKAAHIVRKGNLDVRVPVPEKRDEVRTLSRSFNAMTKQLLDQRAALTAAKDELSDRNDFLETLLMAINAGVIRVNEAGFVLSANPSARALLGWKAGPIGEPLGQHEPEIAQLVAKTLGTGDVCDNTIEFTRGAETAHLRVKTASDQMGGCIVTIDDLTRQVMAQRHIAWRDVARRIAHEIRNPLTPIQLSAERLQRRYGHLEAVQHDDVFDNCVSTILRKVDELGHLVESFSAFATMPEPQWDVFDLIELLNNIVFTNKISFPDIEFNFDPQSAKLLFQGDDRLLTQVFGNLVLNAAQAISLKEGGANTPMRNRVSIVLDQTTYIDGVGLVFEDTGPGFPDDNWDELFEPYVTTNPAGTGLGLSIARRIIADHGGRITLGAAHKDMGGASVEVFLPYEYSGGQSASEAVVKHKRNISMGTT